MVIMAEIKPKSEQERAGSVAKSLFMLIKTWVS